MMDKNRTHFYEGRHMKSVGMFWGVCVCVFLVSGCGNRHQEVVMDEVFDNEEPGEGGSDFLVYENGTSAESASQAAVTAQNVSVPVSAVTVPSNQPTVLTTTEKPTDEQIQTALKNAGLYEGAIDGKIGPNSKRAIRKFQIEHDLVVDGKVGKNTWAKLQPYLQASSQSTVAQPVTASAAPVRSSNEPVQENAY